MKILFINSFQRSGSTLLGNLLNNHCDIRYLGEVRNASAGQHGCISDDSILMSDSFWPRVIKTLPMAACDIPTKKSDGRPTEENFKNIRIFYAACQESSDENWLVDSSHRTKEATSHLSDLGTDFRVIFLTRDGRAILNSVLKRSSGKNPIPETIIFLFRWWRFHIGAKRLHWRLGRQQLLRMKYEDICYDPQGSLKEISDFLGLENPSGFRPKQEKQKLYIGGSPTLKGVQVRLSELREDLSWRAELPKMPWLLFSILGQPLNFFLGYKNG